MKDNCKLHLTTKHTGKMTNMWSLSTSSLKNPWCEAHSKVKGSICEHCYAMRQMKMYKNMSPCYEKNAEILTSRILSDDELPTIPVIYFRFESFGDLINWVQCVNYFNIAKKNPQTKFALFSKNMWIIKEAIESGAEKPDNLQIIQSSMFVNKPDKKFAPWVDKVFTVYSNCENVEINCGARSCFTCHKCYEKNDIETINEKLK